jgi:tRNA(Ile)-lysidine synthase TilS/MesJ
MALSTLALTGRHNLEERARAARYEALAAMARHHGCAAIVTAHTATDQAETLLLRLVRGAGARGLGGMRASRGLDGLRLLRPMLGLLRDDARAYCARHGHEFRDDPTNVDDRPRARLRAEVLPVLERLAPGATLHLAAAAERLRQDDDHLQALAGDVTDRPSAAALRAMAPPVQGRALAAWFERVTGSRRGLSAKHLAALGHLITRGSGTVDLPASLMTRRVAVVESGRLVAQVTVSGEEKGPSRRRMKARGPREH